MSDWERVMLESHGASIGWICGSSNGYAAVSDSCTRKNIAPLLCGMVRKYIYIYGVYLKPGMNTMY